MNSNVISKAVEAAKVAKENSHGANRLFNDNDHYDFIEDFESRHFYCFMCGKIHENECKEKIFDVEFFHHETVCNECLTDRKDYKAFIRKFVKHNLTIYKANLAK